MVMSSHQEYVVDSSAYVASSSSTTHYLVPPPALSVGHEQYQTSQNFHSTSTSSTQNLPPLPPLPPPPPPHPNSVGNLDLNRKSEYSDDGVTKSFGSYNVSHHGIQLASEKKRKKEKEPPISGFKNKKM